MELAENMDQSEKELTNAEILADLKAAFSEAQKADVADFSKIARLASEINKVELRLAKQRKEDARRDAAENGVSDEDIVLSRDEIKRAIRAELKRRNYHYVTANERFWLKTDKNDWIPVSERGISRDIADASSLVHRNILYDVMKEDGRWFDTCTYTFAKTDASTLNMIVRDFAIPQDGEAHWFFDLVCRGVGGEREENYTHIEKLILSKYLHPESVTIPALLFQDDGGTGKSLLIEWALPAIFGEFGVGTNMRVEHVTSKFNAIGQGKAVWFLNEASRGAYSHAALKALVGSATYAIEHKGVNPIIGPMTAWIIMSTNEEDGAVLLEGTEADRRWSVVKGGRNLAELVAERMSVGRDEAKEWIDTVGRFILKDRVEAGRWIASLIRRHGDVCVRQGLHGEDYRSLVHVQRPIERMLLDSVFGDDDFTSIRTSQLYEAYESFVRGSKRTPMGRGKFHAMVTNYLAKNHPNIRKIPVNLTRDGKRSKFDCYHREGSDLHDTTTKYAERDEYGRSHWLIELR